MLLEAGLLPGAMLRNTDMYRCQFVHVRVEQTDTPFTSLCTPGQVLKIPIAHGEGNYYADPETLDELERNRQVIFRYVSPTGDVTKEANPNGSLRNIAGICNRSAQRRRPDAAPRAGLRIAARQRRREDRARIRRRTR